MLNVIFSNSEVLAINKPPLIHSVASTNSDLGASGNEQESSLSIAALLGKDYPETTTASPAPADSGLVNRLDYATSGILIATRTREAWHRYHHLFTQGMVTKRYLVLCDGRLSEQQSIEGYIGTDARRGKRVYFRATKPHRSTRYQISRSTISPLAFFSLPHSDIATETQTPLLETQHTITMAEVTTATGRRHQVRVHMAALGHPLCGDPLYNRSSNATSLEQFLRAHGVKQMLPPFFLHAGALTIALPDREQLVLKAPPPELLTTTLAVLQSRTDGHNRTILSH